MGIKVRCLYEAAYLTTSDVAIVSALPGVTYIIDKVTITNVSATAGVTATVRFVPNGGTAGTNNTVMSAKALAVNECYTCPEAVGQILNPGAFISALASANTSIVIRISGREIT